MNIKRYQRCHEVETRYHYLVFKMLILAVMLFSGCSNMRYLADGERLYTGHRIHIEAAEKHVAAGNLENELNRVVRPVPNQKVLLWRPRLWMYHIAGEPSGKGLRHWLRNRLGRPPVLFEMNDVQRNIRLIQNSLFNMGYFDANIAHELHLKDKKASVDYFVAVKPPYVFASIHPMSYAIPGNVVDRTGAESFIGHDQKAQLHMVIDSLLSETLIHTGAQYRLDMLKAERMRIDRALKQKGYFYFNPDYIHFRADTVLDGRLVDIYPTIKTGIPGDAARVFRIGKVDVVADFMMQQGVLEGRKDGMDVRSGLRLYDKEQQFKPELIGRSVFLNSGDVYRLDNHDRSLAHLSALDVFRFVNMRFTPRYEEGEHFLDVRVLLSPAPRRRLATELRGVSKSNSFAGPGLTASLTNVNLFGGGEHFSLSLNASYETLIGQRLQEASSWEFGLESGMVLPRFALIPQSMQPGSPLTVPKTNLSLGVNFLNRSDAFGMTSLKLRYGYEWTQSLSVRHHLSPMVFNLFVLGQVSENLDRILTGSSLLRRGLFEQFILGSEYSWFYNTQLKEQERRKNDFYVNVNFDLAGNLLNAFSGLLNAKKNTDGEYQYFGQGFAQYAKTDVDLRYYRHFSGSQRLAMRFIAGLGVPYGNSGSLPYLKLFTIGGSNSIRAFHARNLGPGTYVPDDAGLRSFNIYRSGEIKLECNLEYRFGITPLFKGAVFADAGNIWRLKEDAGVPGGQFGWNTFYRQLALGSGAGIRLDATFFILRLDLAFPLIVPYRDTNKVFEPFDPFKKQWRRDRLVFNLAIGYPF